MGIVQNIIGMVRDINDHKKQAQIDDQLKNYMNDPQATINNIMQFAPRQGIAISDETVARNSAAREAQHKGAEYDLGTVRNALRGLPDGTDYGAAVDGMAPMLGQMGIAPDKIAGFRAAIAANPHLLMDDKAYENWSKDQYTSTVATPGAHVIRGGKVIDQVPFAIKAETTPAGSSTNVFNPNTGRFETSGAPSSLAAASPASNPPMGQQVPLTAAGLMPVFHAQESAGSGDYTAVNKDTGALGKYQVMPKTGVVLAKRLGLAWRPDMMRKNDPASQRYQEAIGQAAVQDSIDAGGGDPAKIFSHYYSGSTTAYQRPEGNPKTAKYVNDMLARTGYGSAGGGGAAAPQAGGVVVTPTSVTVPAKPTAGSGKSFRAATPAEIAAAGYPKGTAAQIGSDGKMVNLKTPPAANIPKPYDQEKARGAADTMGQLANYANELLNMPGLDSAVGGFQGHMPAWMLGQNATNWRNKRDTMLSNIGLGKLMEFKAGSSQGASGFGNLSNEEGKRLENAYGSLAGTSDEKTTRDALQTIVQTTQRASERIRWQMQRAEAGLPHDVPAEGTIKGGHRFMGGSPDNPRNWAVIRRAK